MPNAKSLKKPIPSYLNADWWEWDETESFLRCTATGRAVHEWLNSQPLKIVKGERGPGKFAVVEVTSN